MSHTRAAIGRRYARRRRCPEERRRKLNALRLKWHPDKHEVLREMATVHAPNPNPNPNAP